MQRGNKAAGRMASGFRLVGNCVAAISCMGLLVAAESGATSAPA